MSFASHSLDRWARGLALVCSGFVALSASGNNGDSSQESGQPEQRNEFVAVAADVRGNVSYAPIGTDTAVQAGWTPINENDTFGPGIQVKTGFRSFVTFKFGEDTVVHVRPMSNCSMTDHYRTANEKRIRLGLGYGVIRGGSTESELRSDITVDSTVATLAKRGTKGWELEVDPSTGRFRGAVTREGLVDILDVFGRRKSVAANEYATDANLLTMWVKQNLVDLKVSFYADESIGESEVDFSASNTSGTGVLSPGSGTESQDGSQRIDSNALTEQRMVNEENRLRQIPTFVARPEGDFGIGSTLLKINESKRRMPIRIRPIDRRATTPRLTKPSPRRR